MIRDYDDIINLPRHVSPKRQPMSLHDRAAQFSPFSALTGLQGEIKETARLTEERIELDESAKAILDKKLRLVQEKLSSGGETEFEYFLADEMKAGGSYVTVRGLVKKIDMYEKLVIMHDGRRIPIDEIVDIVDV